MKKVIVDIILVSCHRSESERQALEKDKLRIQSCLWGFLWLYVSVFPKRRMERDERHVHITSMLRPLKLFQGFFSP